MPREHQDQAGRQVDGGNGSGRASAAARGRLEPEGRATGQVQVSEHYSDRASTNFFSVRSPPTSAANVFTFKIVATASPWLTVVNSTTPTAFFSRFLRRPLRPRTLPLTM